MNKFKKWFPYVFAGGILILVALTFYKVIPQKLGVSGVFIILGVTNFLVAAKVWRKNKKMEAIFLGLASVLVLLTMLFYFFGM